MKRQFSKRVLFSLAVAGALVVPARAEAQNVFLGNGFSVACLGLDCSQLRFVVNPAGGTVALMSYLQLTNPQLYGQLAFLNHPGLWYGAGFSNPMVVFMPNPSRWIPIVWSQGGNDPYTPPPGNTGDPGNPPNNENPTTPPPENTVTPEPGTMLLLGTGLVGMVGAARRRKAKLRAE